MMRRFNHIATRADTVTLLVDGASVSALAGQTLATALGTAGMLRLRESPRAGAPRGAFCFMGICQECTIYVDGALRQACMTPVAEGMVVELRGVPS
jgi:predicted molibdopterin-dependent oxidoreductase YjgC